jgi:dihydropteroate synthase-like protein
MARYLFVTGKLAEPALRQVLAELASQIGLDYEVAVLNISVAALMTPAWVARHLQVPLGIDRVMLTGYCSGDLAPVVERAGVPVECGPCDLRDLAEHFGTRPRKDYGAYDIEILAEINHAPQLALEAILHQARHYRDAGADVIDVGCDPGTAWEGIGDVVRALRLEGMRVSVDSLNPREIEQGVQAGAELVLSVNSSNVAAARDWGCEVVAIPDVPATLEGLEATLELLTAWGIKHRIDPILEPIGFGFAASLGRYLEVRRRYPQAEMMMGVGNLTELTDVDSAGVNVTLLGFCQELGIRSVLSTEVINWARSCVRELDLARRLVYHAWKNRVLPKRLEPNLVLLRDIKLRQHGQAALEALAARITDKNFRLFVERGLIHVLNGQMFLQGTDPFELFDEMAKRQHIDPAHAFYLGFEMAKAVTTLTLSKNYVQDQALNWGFLTVPEQSHRGTITPEEAKGE